MKIIKTNLKGENGVCIRGKYQGQGCQPKSPRFAASTSNLLLLPPERMFVSVKTRELGVTSAHSTYNVYVCTEMERNCANW